MTLLVSPAPRWSGTLCELPTSSELVLFGGKTTSSQYNYSGKNGVSYSAGIMNDTWIFNSSLAWVNVSTGYTGNTLNNPPPLYEHFGSYDGTYVTILGGSDGISNQSGVYSYSQASGWFKQPITPTNGGILGNPPSYNVFNQPVLIRGAAMAYQSSVAGGTSLIFGGDCLTQRHWSLDTWQLSSGNPCTFSCLSPTSWPPARAYAAMASSPTTALMFGGKNDNGPLGDCYEFTSSGWSVVNGLTPGVNCPSARYGASMIYNAHTSSYILMGGITTNGYDPQVWSFSSGTWTNITSGTPGLGAPLGRAFAQMSYHTPSQSAILFSGLGYSTSYTDTWQLSSLGVWTQLG